MRMFSNYQDLAANYTPNNLWYEFPALSNHSKLCSSDKTKPYEEYNAEGNLIGYFWNYGDTLNLDFSIDGEITVESDAIILTSYNTAPDTSTVGHVGQRCYNILDFKSWTCTSVEYNMYTWTIDTEFIYPLESDRSVYMSADDYLSNKNVEVTLYNFRMEPIVTKQFTGKSQILFDIDTNLSKKLVKGIYYCSMRVYDTMISQTIFDATDCKLLVK